MGNDVEKDVGVELGPYLGVVGRGITPVEFRRVVFVQLTIRMEKLTKLADPSHRGALEKLLEFGLGETGDVRNLF